MDLEQKIKFCEGANFWETKTVPKEGIPSLFMCDGPHGLRKQDMKKRSDHLGVNQSRPATCFPSAVTTASSWDVELLGKIGAAIAAEAADQGVGVFLGPGANIKRNPLCGRNFEYFSEDPYLAGKLAASFIKEAQRNGIGTSLKHFACNNQEYKRFQSNSVLDERTLREIYLTAFEIAVREGRPKTVMCAYNQINGVYCADNEDLLTRILRDEWGFDGLVMTDWGAMHDRVRAFKAGCDLNMPGGSNYMLKETLAAVRRGELDEDDIDRSVTRVKKLAQDALRSPAAVRDQAPCDYDAHHAFARQAAEQGAVLLKNDGDILPLSEGAIIAIVGNMARNMRYQGAGSSHINPTRLVHPADVLTGAPGTADMAETAGATDAMNALGATAVASRTEDADVAIVFAGLPPAYESEGFDREHMRLPDGHVRLIEETAAVNPNTIVVLFCGAPVECPWVDKVKAILYMGLPGQAGGEAVRNLLYGAVNPSGKLAESWPVRYEDCPSAAFYGTRDAVYKEGIYVGYRHYDKAGIKPRWRFGYGLSYTQFSYTNATIEDAQAAAEYSARVIVTNTGDRAGMEAVQLYIAPPEGSVHRPVMELKRFTKVYLQPGESRAIRFTLDERCFAVWADGWKVPDGTYTVLIGGDPDHLHTAGTIAGQRGGASCPELSEPREDLEYESRIPQKGFYTMDNSVIDMKERSTVMKILYFCMEKFVAKSMTRGTPEYRMFLESGAGSPLRSMQIFSGLKAGLFQILLFMANGKFSRKSAGDP